MPKLRFHFLGLAHLETHKRNSSCAYTQKIIKLAKMIKDYGHTIYFYGVEGSEVTCDEFIQVSTQEILKSTYGDYDRSKNFFQQDPNDFAHQNFNKNAINAILENKQDRDILLCPMWIIGFALHIVLILWFTKKFVLNFKIKQVFPAWFIVYVGIVVGSVTGPAYKMAAVGQIAFWFGFVTYLILLPIIIYRVVKVQEMAEPTLPTLAIFAAPASLLLAGYMVSVSRLALPPQ